MAHLFLDQVFFYLSNNQIIKFKKVATAVVALITALARSEAIQNSRKEIEEKKERAEFERLIQEREESRRRKHQKQVKKIILFIKM